MTRRWDSQVHPQFPVPTMDAKRNPDPYEVHDGPVLPIKQARQLARKSQRATWAALWKPLQATTNLRRCRRARSRSARRSSKKRTLLSCAARTPACLGAEAAQLKPFAREVRKAFPLARWLRWALLHSRAARPVRSRLSLGGTFVRTAITCGHMERERHFCKHANGG